MSDREWLRLKDLTAFEASREGERYDDESHPY